MKSPSLHSVSASEPYRFPESVINNIIDEYDVRPDQLWEMHGCGLVLRRDMHGFGPFHRTEGSKRARRAQQREHKEAVAEQAARLKHVHTQFSDACAAIGRGGDLGEQVARLCAELDGALWPHLIVCRTGSSFRLALVEAARRGDDSWILNVVAPLMLVETFRDV